MSVQFRQSQGTRTYICVTTQHSSHKYYMVTGLDMKIVAFQQKTSDMGSVPQRTASLEWRMRGIMSCQPTAKWKAWFVGREGLAFSVVSARVAIARTITVPTRSVVSAQCVRMVLGGFST